MSGGRWMDEQTDDQNMHLQKCQNILARLKNSSQRQPTCVILKTQTLICRSLKYVLKEC